MRQLERKQTRRRRRQRVRGPFLTDRSSLSGTDARCLRPGVYSAAARRCPIHPSRQTSRCLPVCVRRSGRRRCRVPMPPPDLCHPSLQALAPLCLLRSSCGSSTRTLYRHSSSNASRRHSRLRNRQLLLPLQQQDRPRHRRRRRRRRALLQRLHGQRPRALLRTSTTGRRQAVSRVRRCHSLPLANSHPLLNLRLTRSDGSPNRHLNGPSPSRRAHSRSSSKRKASNLHNGSL